MKSDSEPGSHGDYFTTDLGRRYPWLDATDFEEDEAAGHGTHTAGSAAGATINTPADTVTCIDPDVLSCVGGCISASASYDDLVSTYIQYFTLDLDRLCPSFIYCASLINEELCLDDDVAETLTEHGGMARGAKLAIFDIFHEDIGGLDVAGNGMWEACTDAGCKLHSNSWGADVYCDMREWDLLYDDFMYNVSAM